MNTHNQWILQTWRAHCGRQLLLDHQVTIRYTTKYVGKAEKKKIFLHIFREYAFQFFISTVERAQMYEVYFQVERKQKEQIFVVCKLKSLKNIICF